MNRFSVSLSSLALAALLMTPVANAATMNKADYQSAKARISADYKTDTAACAAMKGNAKDVCIEEAKAKDKVARAELTFAYSGKSSDGHKVPQAKAEAAYAVAKERCDDQAGQAKDVCVQEAKAVEVKALADAKLAQQIGVAKRDAAQDKRDADYDVAVAKCDALAAEAKTSCVAAAKAKHGKT